MTSKKPDIFTFQPIDFKSNFVKFTSQQIMLKENINDFFIHALNDRTIHLNLPLPSHKKTVNDFFIVNKGFALREVGITLYEIHKNELLNVPQLQVSTTNFYSDNIDGFYCHFSDDFLEDYSLLLNWKLKYSELHKILISEQRCIRINYLLQIINSLYRENYKDNKNLIAQYLRTVITEINSETLGANRINKKQVISAEYIKFLRSNLNKQYKISDIAEILHLTPNHLNKTIKSHLGKSAQSIYNEVLLQEAKVLLLQTSKDISEIAFDLGFNDVSYFSRFFKKHSNQTPLEYRRMIEKYQ